MPELELRDPLFLLVALAAPLVYYLAARAGSSITYSSLSLPDAGPRSLRARLARLPALLLALSVVSLAIALARPRTGDATTHVKHEGIAIVMAVDHSGSMNARDFVEGDTSISRLDAVKKVFREFVTGGRSGKGRDDDLIGLVAFGTYADGLCPLTLDHRNLLAILDQLQVATERSESATALGEGLGLAVERLRDSPAKSKVVILLTDGVNNAGDLAPEQAAELAKTNHIKVYTIGAGTTGFAPVPVTGPDGRQYLRRMYVEIDEPTLKQIAKVTGGRYFHARDADALAQVIKEIDSLERTQITEVRYLQYEEHYPPFVIAGLALMMAAVLAAGSVLRRLP